MFYKKLIDDLKTERGYTLVEVVISIAVAVLVIGALTFATISSLRNAQLAKRQAQANKYAQEGLEKLRSTRERDEAIVTNFAGSPNKFSGLWAVYMSPDPSCTSGVCYFRFVNGVITQGVGTNFEDVEGNGIFNRQILITDKDTCGSGLTQLSSCYAQEKQITSIVRWTDFAGEHESRLTTILRKI